jgi:hypothetical protein
MGIPGGVPLSPAEQAQREQWTTLRRVVEDALRFMPGGPGQGEGPLPSEIDRVVETLLFLYGVTGQGKSLYDWLGVAFHVEPAVAQTEASLAIRDILLALHVQQSDGLEPDSDVDDLDFDEAANAAELFATVRDEDLP